MIFTLINNYKKIVYPLKNIFDKICMYNMERKGDKMSYKVTISDGTVLENCIQDLQFYIDTSSDYIFTSKNINKNSIIITGYIDTDESTISLYNWALIPATNPDCYKEITVEQYKSEKLLRKVTFSKAFVVKYSESHSYDKGVGTFTLYIKQLYGQDIKVISEDASPSTKTVPSPAPKEKEETQNQNSKPKKKKEKEEKKHIIKVKRRKALKPNTEYEVNGYKYKTDELGRIISCEGSLKLEKGERNEYDQIIVGREDKEKTDDGGHLIATIFGGSGDIDNLVPMDSNLNRGVWRNLEKDWTEALKDGEEVKVKIVPIFEGNSQRPAQFEIQYKIGEDRWRTKTFKNSPGGI